MENKASAANDLLQRRTRELQTLVQVAQLINIIDLDHVLLQTMQLTREAIGASKGSLFLIDDEGRPTQRFITQRDMPPAMTHKVAQEVIEKGLAGWCIRHQEGAIIDSVSQDERWLKLDDDDQADVKSAICLPITHEKKTLGVMTLVSPESNHFSSGNLNLMQAIANQASTAIRNARLVDNLKTQQHQLEFIFQHHNQALLTVDPELTIMMSNPMARGLLLNDSQDTLNHQRFDRLVANTPFDEILRRIQNKTDSAESFAFEIRDEVERRDFTVNVAIMREGERIEGYLIMIHDITSIKDLNRLKSQMIHMLTHDLKNPVNIIWGYIDLLRIDTQSNQPTDQRFIDGILRALHRMDALIEETLQAERFMSTGQPQPTARFNPISSIQEAIKDNREQAETKGITITQQIEHELGAVNGAEFQIREVMNNLINNAIKYTPETGKINVSADAKDGRFNFSVQDNGIGIPSELQKEIFSEFYRAPRPEIKQIAGTGLGLSIVKTIIERHKGEVWFTSEADKGSTFGFWLPLAE